MAPPQGPVRLYIIGRPVSHSLSPAMFNRLLARAGIPGSYEPLEVGDPGELPGVFERLRREARGFNVTIPYKTHAARLVDEASEDAAEIGAVNTVSVESGRLRGFNTDWLGLLGALREAGPLSYSRALLIGAGGAGRAAAYALARVVDELRIVSRGGRSAEELAGRALEWGVKRARWARAEPGSLAELASGVDLVVNASPVGMGDPGATPLPAGLIPEGAVVVDMVYTPLETRLLREARARGCRVVDGLWMLAHQAAVNARIWLGLDVDAGELRRYALEALQGRGGGEGGAPGGG